MKNCPKCGQPRQGEAYKCQTCDVFYSQLDEILYADQKKQKLTTIEGRLKHAWASKNRRQAVLEELRTSYQQLPLQAKVAIWTIGFFVFALMVSVL